MKPQLFVMAGGGTGGHVIPGIAVAQELQARGHRALFVGTHRGVEARMVPAAGFPIEWIEIGSLKGQALTRRFQTALQLPIAARKMIRMFAHERPGAVFSMGGYVAGPVMAAAVMKSVPLVVMEPNAMPGVANRYIGRFVARALLSFEEAGRWFPKDRVELSGLPVRREFFEIPPKPSDERLTVLITGGSQGARSLNRAAEQSWPLFRAWGRPVRLLHQTGTAECEGITKRFAASGLEGEVWSFIADMPAAFAQADIVVCRSGAGAVAEVAAAGKASVLVPYPFAADQHQLRNAEALARRGAARLVLNGELTGQRLFDEVTGLAAGGLEELSSKVRSFAKPGAAERAAEILIDLAAQVRNN